MANTQDRPFSILECPSGTLLYDFDNRVILKMWSAGTVKFTEEPFTLSGGGKSHFYFGGREDVTDDPRLLQMLGDKVRRVVYRECNEADQCPCLIAIPTVATAIAVA